MLTKAGVVVADVGEALYEIAFVLNDGSSRMVAKLEPVASKQGHHLS